MEQVQKIAAVIANANAPIMRFNSKCAARGYPQHSGQDVLVYAEPRYSEPVFRVVATDGWEGLAFPNDLSEAEGR